MYVILTHFASMVDGVVMLLLSATDETVNDGTLSARYDGCMNECTLAKGSRKVSSCNSSSAIFVFSSA